MQRTHNAARPTQAILVGGLIAGVLDMTYAMVVYTPKHPFLIPQGIAAGLLGVHRQLGGEAGTTVLGFVLHFVIAVGAASVFYVTSRQWESLTHHPAISGMIFGACVYLFMHFVVIPLSALPHADSRLSSELPVFIWHWFGVGLPISFAVRYYTR